MSNWPEPIIRVQHLSESGISEIPDCYVKKASDRPIADQVANEVHIPIIDMQELYSHDATIRNNACQMVDYACRDWGFFQVVNHGISRDLMVQTREAWLEFFKLPLEEKQKYSNLPSTYEGYGSRIGVEKGQSLDWNDYFFLHFLPLELKDENKWPTLPVSCRKLMRQYSNELVSLCGKLMKVFSTNLGLEEDYLKEAFGGDNNMGACMRANYYPKCPQPDLTLGLSPHSDPGGMTLIFPDEISGLQVRHDDYWVPIKPIPNAFIVNLGDQLQVISNAKYKSVDHRVVVNSMKERISLAFFYNPRGDILIKPADQLIGNNESPLYSAMTFNEYRMYIRTKGPSGKSQVESLKATK